jgi:GTPase SAR1 family protein
MDGYQSRKQSIIQVNAEVLRLFDAAKTIQGVAADSFADWEKTCAALPAQLAEETIRVAVVGPIKSGKSTFLNSVLRGDYLKRGAGVVTSIVTRVRRGENLKATLYFKSWAEVNADMEQALVLFPAANWPAAAQPFDLRREADRGALRRALEALDADQVISDDARNRNMVLLSCYLQGYDTVSRFIADEQVTRLYEKGQFIEHWKFAGDERLAVYLQDIELRVNSGTLGSNIEIADCQGSDSSNPLHLAMIQDYLRLAHLLVYVISSRTGLRRADIKFLSMIKKMGILENTLFVLNCDFSEHRSFDELKGLIDRVGEELGLIKPGAEVCAFSALFNLFRSQPEHLAERERRRLEHWVAEADLVDFSERETGRFFANFTETLDRKRHALLFQNHVERLNAIIAGMTHWVSVSRDILARDASGAQQVAERIRRHQQRFGQIQSALQNALSGTVPKLKQELGSDVNRFLDTGSGEVVAGLNRFITGYRVDAENYAEALRTTGITQVLYHAFQEFRQALDAYITEQINPEIIRFTTAEEGKIREALESIAEPYKSLIEDAYAEFCTLIADLGVAVDCGGPGVPAVPGVSSLLRNSGLAPHPLVSSLRYTAKIRTEAVLRLGFYRLLTGFKKVLKKPVTDGEENARALKEGMRRIKNETRKSLDFLFKDYQENFKFRYLYRLVDLAAERLSEAVAQQLKAYSADFRSLAESVNLTREDKERATALLHDMDRRGQKMAEGIAQIKREIAAPGAPGPAAPPAG